MHRWPRITALIVGTLVVLGGALSPAHGQDLRAVGQLTSSGDVVPGTSGKITAPLRALIADFRALGITRETAGTMDPSGRFSSDVLRVDGAGRVQIYASVSDTTESILAALRRHGFDIEIVNADLGIVQGWIPVDAVEDLAQEPVVTKIRPASYGRPRQGRPRTGSVDSQGETIHRCDQARAMGFTGAGVKVGVISNGVSGLADSQASGNLGPVEVLGGGFLFLPFFSGGGDEGTAMLEIVADCAPGAPLAFSPGNTTIEFINSVNALQADGAQIIVDDIGFLTEPFFEDGVVAMNDRVAGAAVLRVSAAGNDALGHYQAPFNPGPVDPGRGTRHDFGGGDTRMRISIPGGANAVIVLQWGNPFGAAADDYDLYVFQKDSDTVVARSNLRQTGHDDPLEFVQVNCTVAPASLCSFDIQISLFSGAAQTLELFCFGPCRLVEFNNPADSIFGQAAVPEVLAVAASPASNPTALENFSSQGPSTLLFPPVVRNKPDLTGIDGVNTSRPGFAPFFGTSAAAPHVAGVAALVAQANPSYLLGSPVTSSFFANALRATAVDLGPPGWDPGFGFGRADALNAVSAELAKAHCQIQSSRSSVPVGQQFTVSINTFPGAGDPWDIYVVARSVVGGTVTLFSLNLTTGGLGPPNVVQPGRATAPITASSQSFTFTAPVVGQVTAFCVLADPALTRIAPYSSVSIAFTP